MAARLRRTQSVARARCLTPQSGHDLGRRLISRLSGLPCLMQLSQGNQLRRVPLAINSLHPRGLNAVLLAAGQDHDPTLYKPANALGKLLEEPLRVSDELPHPGTTL